MRSCLRRPVERGASEASRAHNPAEAGSTPAPATNNACLDCGKPLLTAIEREAKTCLFCAAACACVTSTQLDRAGICGRHVERCPSLSEQEGDLDA